MITFLILIFVFFNFNAFSRQHHREYKNDYRIQKWMVKPFGQNTVKNSHHSSKIEPWMTKPFELKIN